MNRIICKNRNWVYFVKAGYLCRGETGKQSFVKESTIKRLGLIEGNFKG